MVSTLIAGWGLMGLLPHHVSPQEIETEVRQRTAPLQELKKSPLKFPPDNVAYEFPWMTEGLVKSSSDPQLRFRVFSQNSATHEQLAPQVTSLLLKLWQYNSQSLGIDHRPDYRRLVDVYLCIDGQPGGQQLFDEDLQAPRGQSTKANNIYIYDLASFTDPIERLREVAHEYGHAVLSAIGGYSNPEYWANGFLGEKLFLTQLSREKGSSETKQPDWMVGASNEALALWVQKECTPLMLSAAQSFPPTAMEGINAAAMNRYIGLMLWMQFTHPPKVLGRIIKFQSDPKPATVPSSIVEAVDGAGPFEFSVPAPLKGKTIWLPWAKYNLTGCKLVSKKEGWVQVQVTTDKISATQSL